MSNLRHTTLGHRSIELHIEELVLHGFSGGDPYAIADGLQLELVRLLTEENRSLLVTRDTRRESMDAGALRLTPASRSELIGVQVAQALFGGLATTASGSRDNHDRAAR